jgi:parallel beta-helix repeat protein
MGRRMYVIWALVVLGVFVCSVPAVAGTVNCSKQRLQAFINKAQNGATILVKGTCIENIEVPENLSGITLDGQGSAIISGPNANKHTIQVRGRAINIKGFTITGGLDGIGVIRGGTARIENNTLQNTERFGIEVVEHSYAEILGNTIQNNPKDGIYINENSSARIGFTFYPIPDPRPNTIQSNGGSGVFVIRSSNAIIVANTITNNKENGVKVVRTSHADISDNTINGNQDHGVAAFQNSGVNLGNDSGSTIFDLPNTGVNSSWGIRCSLGGYVDGRRGDLDGDQGDIFVDVSCLNSTIP